MCSDDAIPDVAPPFCLSPACLEAKTVAPLAERRNRRDGRIFAALAALPVLSAGIAFAGGWLASGALLGLMGGAVAVMLHGKTGGGKCRRRRELWLQPFPAEAEAFLLAEIPQYRALDGAGRELFRQRAKMFLDEVMFHWAGMDADDSARLRAAAAAVIPTLGFSEWEWTPGEIIFRPDGFEDGTYVDDNGVVTEFEESGMVGDSGPFSGAMMLSANDLAHEFAHPEEGLNVGFHEFAHLMAWRIFPGLPGLEGFGWERLMESERRAAVRRDSLLDEYALLNEDELFAVGSELFFTIPHRLRRRHRELYGALVRAYRQDPCRWLEPGEPPPPPQPRGRRRKGGNSGVDRHRRG